MSADEAVPSPKDDTKRKGSIGRNFGLPSRTKLSLANLRPRAISLDRSLSKTHLVEINVLSKAGDKRSKRNTFKFGQALESLLDEGREIPLFVLRATSYLEANALEMEGIFYFESEQHPHVIALQQLLEKGEADFQSIKDPRTLAGVLKLFFAKLPEPLFTYELYDDFISTSEIDDEFYLITSLRSLVYRLPKNNRVLLQYLLSFLNRVALCSDKNLMTVSKLAKSFGPVLLKSKLVASDSATQLSVQCPMVIKKLMTNYDKIFMLTEEQDTKYHIRESIPYVRLASLDSLLKRLLDDMNPESDFRDIFLSCHLYFINCVDLLKKLLHLYRHFVSGTPTVWQEKARIRLLKLIKHWVKNYSKEILPEAEDFIQVVHHFIETAKEASSGLLPLLKLLESPVSNEVTPQETPTLTVGATSTLQILDINPLEIAKQLTLFDYSLFAKVDVSECILKRHIKEETSPSFTQMTYKFNQWVYWVATEILKRNEPEKRADVIAQFIKIADNCKELCNYNTSFAIVAGLNLSSISRLKQTWPKVPKAAMSKYEKLMEFYEPSKNYKNYRDEITKTQPPLVPYFALYPKYLFSIEENNENMIDGMIHFAKMRLIYHIMREMRSYQSGPSYGYSVNPDIYDLIKSINVLDEQSLFNLSVKYEPKEDKQKVVLNPMMAIGKKQRKERARSDSIDNKEEDDDEKLTEKSFTDLTTALSSTKACRVFEQYLESINKKPLLTFLKEVGIYKQLDDPLQFTEKGVQLLDLYMKLMESVLPKGSTDEEHLQQLKEKINHKICTPESFNFAGAQCYVQLESVWNSFHKSDLYKNAIR